jgi:hypothetical protein
MYTGMHLKKMGSTERRAFTLSEAAALCGVCYQTLYRAAVRGDLKVLTGFGRMMVSAQELDRFLSKAQVYRPNRRKTATKNEPEQLVLPS